MNNLLIARHKYRGSNANLIASKFRIMINLSLHSVLPKKDLPDTVADWLLKIQIKLE